MESVQLYPWRRDVQRKQQPDGGQLLVQRKLCRVWRRDVQPPGGETTILSAKADQLVRDLPKTVESSGSSGPSLRLASSSG